MRIALELYMTEYQMLIELLNSKIAKTEEYRVTHKEFWRYTEAAALYSRMKLRNKIQEFCEWQARLDKEEKR